MAADTGEISRNPQQVLEFRGMWVVTRYTFQLTTIRKLQIYPQLLFGTNVEGVGVPFERFFRIMISQADLLGFFH